jgi:hypothetical protein
MSSLPALLLAFEQLKTDVNGSKRSSDELSDESSDESSDASSDPDSVSPNLPGEPGGDGAVETSPGEESLPPIPAVDPGIKADPFTKMGLLLANDLTPKAVNRNGKWAPIAPFATYVLRRSAMGVGVQFKQYAENHRFATVLFITPDSKYKDVYTPFINAWKRGSGRYSTPITYQWPEDTASVYSANARAHLGKLGTEVAAAAGGVKHETSIGSVFVFVKVGTMEAKATTGKFLCLGRFEVTSSSAGTTTLLLLPDAAVPPPAVPLPAVPSARSAATRALQQDLARPTFVDADIGIVSRELSNSDDRLQASDVRPA